MNSTPVSRCSAQTWRSCGLCLRQSRLQRAFDRRPISTSPVLRASTKNPLRMSTSSSKSGPSDPTTQYKRRMMFSAVGMAACAVAMYATIKVYGPDIANNQEANEKKNDAVQSNSIKLDSPAGSEFPSSPSVIRIQGQDGVEQVQTGNSTVPTFPSTIRLPKDISELSLEPNQDVTVAPQAEEEYQLLGLGPRTVSFLGIQVYIVGLYIAKSDLANLQKKLVATGVQPTLTAAAAVGATSSALPAPEADGVAATSLVSTEREALKKKLLSADQSEEAWSSILREGNIRTAIRIVPTRNTDFMHMRDSWVRLMSNKAQQAAAKAKEEAKKQGKERPEPTEYDDEAFGRAMNEFKAVMGGGSRRAIPKGQVLLLLRDQQGTLDVLFHADPKQRMRWLGRVADERVSRAVWLNYLGGKTVASEPARASIVDGVMGIVERPVGTITQKVV
ncbi:hypothetical protein VTN31DRAFT_5575 [Thermomyces dupontii]|uniref:uncharacterized protein n=1 Tax=Talaromyces thermophilus TaxID=28565 RepID=UPI003742EEC2